MTNTPHPRFFVWRYASYAPYRYYSTRRHEPPAPDDVRCIWRGNDENEALVVMRKANSERRKAKRIEWIARARKNKMLFRQQDESIRLRE